MSMVIHDVTDFTAQDDWPVLEGGQLSLSGSAEGFMDDATMPPLITQAPTAAWVLQSFAAKTYTFAALCENFDLAVSQTGLVLWSCNFRASKIVVVA